MSNVGTGCTSRNDGLPPHNPRPSTARGKRRHANRGDGAKKAAEAAWNRGRSTQESKLQRQLNESGKLMPNMGK